MAAGREVIRLNVKQVGTGLFPFGWQPALGVGDFTCGHYQLEAMCECSERACEADQSSPYKIDMPAWLELKISVRVEAPQSRAMAGLGRQGEGQAVHLGALGPRRSSSFANGFSQYMHQLQ